MWNSGGGGSGAGADAGGGLIIPPPIFDATGTPLPLPPILDASGAPLLPPPLLDASGVLLPPPPQLPLLGDAGDGSFELMLGNIAVPPLPPPLWGSGDGSQDDWNMLVKQCKDVQKRNPSVKERWVQYAAKLGGGNRDPGRHGAEFLRGFMITLTPDLLVSDQTVQCEDAALVSKIKELQRTSPEIKEQWVAYTQSMGGGRQDPNRQSVEFIQAFLQAMEQGMRFDMPVIQEVPVDLVSPVKMLQKRSGNFRVAWSSYCQKQSWGVNDPAKHDPFYHVEFFDFIAAKFNLMMELPISPPVEESGQAAKKAKLEQQQSSGSSWGKGDGSGSGGGDTAHKENLVQSIKNFQRQSEENREIWSAYADQHLRAMRDPNRHDEATLQDFLLKQGFGGESHLGESSISSQDGGKDAGNFKGGKGGDWKGGKGGDFKGGKGKGDCKGGKFGDNWKGGKGGDNFNLGALPPPPAPWQGNAGGGGDNWQGNQSGGGGNWQGNPGGGGENWQGNQGGGGGNWQGDQGGGGGNWQGNQSGGGGQGGGDWSGGKGGCSDDWKKPWQP